LHCCIPCHLDVASGAFQRDRKHVVMQSLFGRIDPGLAPVALPGPQRLEGR
jgi:hypothetical protein